MSLPVLTAVTGVWEASLVAGLERSAGDVRVARRCVDLAELLSAAGAGLGRAAVLSADLHRLDREAVAQLLHAGVAVVGLADPGDDDARRRLADLGVERVLAADQAAAEVAIAVVEAVHDLDRAVGPWLRAAALPASDPADALGPAPAVPDDRDGGRPGGPPGSRPGRLVAVWGPVGSPGRTTVAVSLAGELAHRGAQTLLVDADTYGPSVAQTLGMLDESGGIAGAVRAANSGALDVDRLARLAPGVSPTLRVLTGLPQPSRWPELRPSALESVWSCARDLARWTVVDCGFCLEADEELSFDNRCSAPQRRHPVRPGGRGRGDRGGLGGPGRPAAAGAGPGRAARRGGARAAPARRGDPGARGRRRCRSRAPDRRGARPLRGRGRRLARAGRPGRVRRGDARRADARRDGAELAGAPRPRGPRCGSGGDAPAGRARRGDVVLALRVLRRWA